MTVEYGICTGETYCWERLLSSAEAPLNSGYLCDQLRKNPAPPTKLSSLYPELATVQGIYPDIFMTLWRSLM